MKLEVKSSFRFKREERLKGRNEIREVFNKGKRYVSKGDAGRQGAKLFVLKNDLPHNRICFTFSRGFGNAVERNHARRLGREAYRSFKPCLRCGFDMILLVYRRGISAAVSSVQGPGGRRPEDARATFTERTEQLQFLLARAGLLL